MTKPISFKTAFLIVIGLHLFGFLLLTQWSSIRYQIAKVQWNEKKEKLVNRSSDSVWTTAKNIKPIITQVPPKLKQTITNQTTQPKSLSKPVAQKQLIPKEKPTPVVTKQQISPQPKPKSLPVVKMPSSTRMTSTRVTLIDPKPVRKQYSNMPLVISGSPRPSSPPIKISYFQDGVTYEQTIEVVNSYPQL